jgi:hypothetical protein
MTEERFKEREGSAQTEGKACRCGERKRSVLYLKMHNAHKIMSNDRPKGGEEKNRNLDANHGHIELEGFYVK